MKRMRPIRESLRKTTAYLDRLRGRPVLFFSLGVGVFALFAAGIVYSYQTYDYVQHDNDFCMSCHLMADPFELFAESAHRGLGCKACHQPTMVARTQMAMTQILENPDEITVHADVPNERCVACHVDGDPDTWRSIASSAGHRVHLESTDTTLVEIGCVECHSSSVHQFAPVDETCGQSGCHADNTIELGEMSDLTIHCVACHSFSAPVDPVTTAQIAATTLTPGGGECFTCHAMRVLAEMPPNDPHEEQCASCHNPHEQETPADAVQSCAIGGCHDDAESLTPFHQGIHVDQLTDCMSCHTAHDFSLDGNDCVACHQDVFDAPGAAFPASPSRIGTLHQGVTGVRFASAAPLSLPTLDIRSRLAQGSPAVWTRLALKNHEVVTPTAPIPQADSVVFLHGEHRDVGCLSCHNSEDGPHGEVAIATVQDCRSCHHTEPESSTCVTCHEEGGTFEPSSELSRTHSMAFEVKSAETRALPFDHDMHQTEDCASCHVQEGDVTLPATSVSCASCHEDHHTTGASVACRSCHVEAPVESHPVEEVHLTCSGAGCHAVSSLDDIPREREFCLSCHQDLVDHKEADGRPCAACHTLPDPRNAGGSS